MGGPLVNSAFVFIKPHAVTEATKALVKATLEANGVRIVKEGDIKSEVRRALRSDDRQRSRALAVHVPPALHALRPSA